MADPMKIRANVVGDSTEVKVLMNHEMETGPAQGRAGQDDPRVVHPERHGRRTTARPCCSAVGPAVAKNPFLSFKFKGGAKGDKVQITGPTTAATSAPTKRRSRDSPAVRVADRAQRAPAALGGSTGIAIGTRRGRGAGRGRRRVAFGQGSTVDEIAKYREALQDGNPAELWEARGEEMWNDAARTAQGVVRDSATWASGPASSRAPTRSCRATSPTPTACMDLESRLVWCMVNLQGDQRSAMRRRSRSATAARGAPTSRRSPRMSRRSRAA